MGMSLRKLWEIVKDRKACHAAVHGVTRVRHDWATEQITHLDLQDLTHTYGGQINYEN